MLLTGLGVSIVTIKGVDILEKVLQKHNGEDAVISIFHKLYGSQKIKCKLDCITDSNRIGFCIRSGQEIYIHKDKIVNFNVGSPILFEDDLMTICVCV
jgi:hypothetical protein